MRNDDLWPELPYPAWRETALTLQLWTQIVGKVRLRLTPWLNHGWQVPLYVTARGLGTSPIPVGHEILEIEFDFIAHRLRVRTSRGEERACRWSRSSVADFYARDARAAARDRRHGHDQRDAERSGGSDPLLRGSRSHASYDPRCGASLLARAGAGGSRVQAVPQRLSRQGQSPVHFFWGSFDLAVTRFSGRPRRCIPAACRACRTR